MSRVSFNLDAILYPADPELLALLRAEVARVTMTLDILGKATAYLANGQK